MGATTQSDVYALGAVLFECLTGVVPYPKDSEAAVLYAHMSDPPPKVTDVRPELPAALDTVLARAMAKDPAERPNDATAVIDDAKRAFTSTSRAAMSVPRPAQRAEDEGRRAPEGQVETKPARPQPAEVAGATVASKAREPEPPSGPVPVPHRPDRRPVALIALGLFALGLIAGAFVLGSQGMRAAADGTRVLSTPAFTVTAPGGWSESQDLAEINGMRFADAVELEAPGGAGALRIGMLGSDATGRTLLPATFRATLGDIKIDTEDPVRVGEVQAYRFADLSVDGSNERGTIYTAPTSTGVLGAACTGSAEARATCETIVNTLELRHGHALDLGPSAEYARALDAAVERTNAAQEGLDELDGESTLERQAEVLADTARLYGEAADGVEAAPPGPGAAQLTASWSRRCAAASAGTTR